jgi:glycerophosphoryl diester phosphodiesterase
MGGGPVSATVGGIFISYRRQETAFPAGWLYDRLRYRFGPDQVFKDVDNIDPGDDFIDKITTAVGSCDVLLALMGREWLTIRDAGGGRRLDDPEDFVRVEIEAALSRGVRVIPLLIDGAVMPRADQLPASLARLVRRQAQELSPSRFDADANRLVVVLERTLAEARAQREAQEQALRESERERAAALERAHREAETQAQEREQAQAREQAQRQAREQAQREAQAQALRESEQERADALERVHRESEVRARLQRESEQQARRDAEARARQEPEARAQTDRESEEKAFTGLPVPAPVEQEVTETPPPGRLSRRRTLIGVAVGTLLVPVLILVGVKVIGSPGGHPASGSTGAASAGSASPTPSPSPTPVTFGVPSVLAHRGGEEVYPPETIPAFGAAAKAGYAVETDVRWTRDGVPVLIHNDDLSDGVTCSGRYSVVHTDWSTLRKWCHPTSKKGQAVYPLAGYQEAIDTIAKYPDAQFFPEVKVDQTSRQVQQYLKALEDADLTARTVVTSFFPEELAKIRAQAQSDQVKIRLMLFQTSRTAMSAVQDKGLWAVAVEKQVVTRSYVAKLHDLGLKVIVWTVNGDKEWASAMATGADAVLTDYPEQFLAWKASR